MRKKKGQNDDNKQQKDKQRSKLEFDIYNWTAAQSVKNKSSDIHERQRV